MATQRRRQSKPRAATPGRANGSRVVTETVASVVAMEQREREPATHSLRMAEAVTSFSGSLLFVAVNAAWFAGWIVWNSGVAGLPVFDPYPFTFLTFAVSLEAIFLATFVLISQNRQSVRADRRSVIDLQVNVIAERELTKILKLTADIHRHVSDGDSHDIEVDEMLKALPVEELERRADEAENGTKETRHSSGR